MSLPLKALNRYLSAQVIKLGSWWDSLDLMSALGWIPSLKQTYSFNIHRKKKYFREEFFTKEGV